MKPDLKPKYVLVTVTNDLNQDQRMHRICHTLVLMGFQVLLVGRARNTSKDLLRQPFLQKRLPCIFQSGFIFYAEYNVRLLFFLWFKKDLDILYAVDLDTIMPVVLTKMLRRKKVIFDAHEYFTETPELQRRRFTKWIWKAIGHFFVPKADLHITVGKSLSEIFTRKYRKPFTTLYSAPLMMDSVMKKENNPPYILYQGMLNQGRGLEQLIEAMPFIQANCECWIIGEGDLSVELRNLANASQAKERIQFLGWKDPEEIRYITQNATIGLNLLQTDSLSYYYSLANKFFDYMNAEVPSINMYGPEYERILSEFPMGIMVENLDPTVLATTINGLLNDTERLDKMRRACKMAKQKYNWQNESMKLAALMDKLAITTKS